MSPSSDVRDAWKDTPGRGGSGEMDPVRDPGPGSWLRGVRDWGDMGRRKVWHERDLELTSLIQRVFGHGGVWGSLAVQGGKWQS